MPSVRRAWRTYRRHAERMRHPESAGRAAVVGGLLLVAVGATGAIAAVRQGRTLLASWWPELESAFAPVLGGAETLAALGGLSVMLGGLLILERHRVGGAFLVFLGSGVGVLTFVLNLLILLFARPELATFLLYFKLGLHGLAVLLIVYAQIRA